MNSKDLRQLCLLYTYTVTSINHNKVQLQTAISQPNAQAQGTLQIMIIRDKKTVIKVAIVSIYTKTAFYFCFPGIRTQVSVRNLHS